MPRMNHWTPLPIEHAPPLLTQILLTGCTLIVFAVTVLVWALR